jgi:O-antigen ligase
MLWLLGGYRWLFIHRPFEVWPWLGAMHVERVYMIVTIVCWLIAAKQVWLRNRLNAAFVFFWCVVFASFLQSPYQCAVEDYFKVAVFYVILITTVRTQRDLKRIVVMFLVAMGLYMAHSFREYLCGRHAYAMNVGRMIGVDSTLGDPNAFGMTLLYTLPMVWPVWREYREKWCRMLLAGYVALACVCILETGSRSAFAGLCLVLLVAALLSRYRLRILTGLVVTAPLVWCSLRPDLQNRFLTLWDPSYGPKNAQQSAEGRAQGWRDGVRLWQEHPVLGVGPEAFGTATGLRFQSHELYGQALGELGTLGAIAFAGVVGSLFANYFEMRRVCRREPAFRDRFPAGLVSAVTLSVVLLLIMGLGAHNLYRYEWLWFGAFQAIALCCLRDGRLAAASESVGIVHFSPMQEAAR